MRAGRTAGRGVAGVAAALLAFATALWGALAGTEAPPEIDGPVTLALPTPVAGERTRLPGELLYAILEDGRLAAWYAVDGHLHSEASGDSRTTLRELVRFGAKRGLDAMVVTDHNTLAAAPLIAAIEAARPPGTRPALILGEEAGAKGGHVGLWNVTAHSRPEAWAREDRPVFSLMRVAAKRNPDAVSVLNHPGWTDVSGDLWRAESFDPRTPGPKFDAIELWNGRLYLQRQTRRLIEGWESLLERGLRPSIVASSDAHFGFHAGVPQTMVLAAGLDGAHVAEAVRAGRTYLTDDARVSVTLGGLVLGETLHAAASEAPWPLRVAGTSAKGGTLRILDRREVLLSTEVAPGPFEVALGWTPRAPLEDGWVRVEILRPERFKGRDVEQVVLVTAPIYYDVVPDGDFWCARPGAWRDHRASPSVASGGSSFFLALVD